MHLVKRLATAASLVRPNSRMADIGTDHAFLPIWLIQQGYCTHAIATDLRVGPAERAIRNVTAQKLEYRISVRLGDGLSPILPEEVDDIVIAGMGGETIAFILQNAGWTKNEQYHFVLQPMTKHETLRKYLLENGYALLKEHVSVDGGRLYPVMSVQYNPNLAAEQATIPAINYRGVIDEEEGREYIKKQRQRLLRNAEAQRGAGYEDDAQKLEDIAKLLDD